MMTNAPDRYAAATPSEPERPPVVAMVSLGCVKNLVDSEVMLGRLAAAGAIVTDDEQAADVIVINTCGFLRAAREEGYGEIRRVLQLKRRRPWLRVIAAGCLVQHDRDELLEQFPKLDCIIGVNDRNEIVSAVFDRLGRRSLISETYHRPWLDTARLRLTGRHTAYLRICEGCNQKCSFCMIPRIRGPLRSKPPQLVLEEARELIADGAVELIIIGQDTTSYGRDIGYEPGLPGLLQQLNELPNIRWLRLMYAYPSLFSEQLIEALARLDKLVKYVDIPLQHISDRVLKKMRRGTTARQIRALIETLRKRVPGIAIRTTLMVGFPGESDDDFKQLLDFVRDVEFDAMGAFVYSREPQTASASMRPQVPRRVAEQRYHQLMQLQRKIAFAAAKRRLGSRLDVLLDERNAETKQLLGRHAGQAPEVDGRCIVRNAGPQARPGKFLTVRIIGAAGYDLLAEPLPADGAMVR